VGSAAAYGYSTEPTPAAGSTPNRDYATIDNNPNLYYNNHNNGDGRPFLTSRVHLSAGVVGEYEYEAVTPNPSSVMTAVGPRVNCYTAAGCSQGPSPPEYQNEYAHHSNSEDGYFYYRNNYNNQDYAHYNNSHHEQEFGGGPLFNGHHHQLLNTSPPAAHHLIMTSLEERLGSSSAHHLHLSDHTNDSSGSSCGGSGGGAHQPTTDVDLRVRMHSDGMERGGARLESVGSELISGDSELAHIPAPYAGYTSVIVNPHTLPESYDYVNCS